MVAWEGFNLGTIFQMKNHSIDGDVQQVQGVQRKFKMFKEVQKFKKISRVQIKQKKEHSFVLFSCFLDLKNTCIAHAVLWCIVVCLYSQLPHAVLRRDGTRTCFYRDIINPRFGIEFLDHEVVVAFDDLDVL